MNVIIVGCGRAGSSLAKLLDTPDNEVTVVDSNENAFAHLGSEFQGHKVFGRGYDEDVLIEAGIQTCDALAVVTGEDDVNLMATEVARVIFGVPHVITRLVNPDRAELYQQLGLDYVSDTELVAENISAKLRARRAHHVDAFGDFEVLSFPLETQGTVLLVRDIEDLGEVTVVLVQHDDEAALPAPNMFLHDGDILLVVARGAALEELAPYMKD